MQLIYRGYVYEADCDCSYRVRILTWSNLRSNLCIEALRAIVFRLQQILLKRIEQVGTP